MAASADVGLSLDGTHVTLHGNVDVKPAIQTMRESLTRIVQGATASSSMV